ncbi:ABC transporter ATP-binding protein [Alteromonas pelagimontana]|uniref:ABC transporter ATP-binding protein n=1 Tax=Alteromonas pelagimontana TaxID=1858656 RepID=A0A6M4MDJ0_9ALTE|nr:ABC transporter ATP-binding protein [Alteromonas pelagimontana]QJR80645.1 ABC transporter ATP-binding protein [Alteromonas pelagimontana]
MPQPAQAASTVPCRNESSLAVALRDIKFAYHSGEADVIRIPQWSLGRNEHCFIAGASGTGKSTFLNLITGALSPNEGEIRLLDQPFSALSVRQRDKFRSRHIGVVFQQFNLIHYLSVRQNIEVAAYFGGSGKELTEDKIHALFAGLQLSEDLLEKRADNLSVGQQQRVAIARALINAPELLIVDEPTSALDASARDKFMELLLATAKASAVIFVSHDPALAGFFKYKIDICDINQAARNRS